MKQVEVKEDVPGVAYVPQHFESLENRIKIVYQNNGN